MSAYNNLNDDDEDDEILFDAKHNNDEHRIRLDDRFTQNPKEQKKRESQNRGLIKISLHEQHSPSTSIADTSSDEEPMNNGSNDKNNTKDDHDATAQFIITSNTPNIDDHDHNTNITPKKQKKKKQKKKKKKYKTKKSNKSDTANLIPMEIDTNVNTRFGENINDKQIQNKVKKKKKKQKRKRKKRLSRNDRIKLYIKTQIDCWLFVGLMLSIFIFSFSAIAVGCAEDLVLFYAKYMDLICHYASDVDIETEQKLIGDVFTHSTLQNFFTASAGCCILSVFALLISVILFCSDCAKHARASFTVKVIYCMVFEIGLLALFVWNVILTVRVEDELHLFLTDLKHCDDEDESVISQEKSAKEEAHELFNEFEVMALLILPLILIVICTSFYIKIKACS